MGTPTGANVHLTPELERFAQSCVRDGRYNNVSEVVRSALRLLQEQRRVAFVASLQAATAEAERDGFVPASAVEANVLQVINAVVRRPKV